MRDGPQMVESRSTVGPGVTFFREESVPVIPRSSLPDRPS
jgi:hypothetical protein